MAAQAVDVVALLRADTMQQVVVNGRPMRASVYDRTRLMDHPLENGSLVTDHAVRDPIEIDLPLMVKDREAFEELRQLYLDRTLLIVQTRMASYPSMVLAEIPHEELPDSINVVPIAVRLREAIFVATVYTGLAPAKVKDKAKASTNKKGAQQTTKASPAKEEKAKDTMALKVAKGLGFK